MKRALCAVAIVFGATGVGGAAAPPTVLLALTGIGAEARLLALEPRTLEPRGSLQVPDWAFGREWAHSPDGERLALVPKPSETNERMFVIGIRGSLRILAQLPFPGEDVCRLAWPTKTRLLVVLTRGTACYGAIESSRVLVVDALRARVVAERPLSGPATVVATARTRGGLALLLAPTGRRSGARLVLIAAAGTRSIPLPTLSAVPRPLDKSIAGSAVGLTVDGERRYAYLAEPQGRIMEVDLASGKVRARDMAFRKPASTAKGIRGPAVQALALPGGSLAVTGVTRTSHGDLVPLGLWLVDTRTWRSRLRDPGARGISYSAGALLVVGAIGLRAYDLDGSLRFRVLDGRSIGAARAQAGYAYVAVGPAPGATSVVDLSDGRVEAPGPNAVSISPFELLAGSGH